MASKRKKKGLGPVHSATLRCIASHTTFMVFRDLSGEEERRHPSSPMRTHFAGDLRRSGYRIGDATHRALLDMVDSGAWELFEADGMTRLPDALPE